MMDLLSSFLGDMKTRAIGWSNITHSEASVSSVGFRQCHYMANKFVTTVLCCALLACTDTGKPPTGVLSKDEMAKILTEFYVREARINTLHLDSDSAKRLMEYYRFKYAEQSEVPDSVIDISYQYYLAHPTDLGEIYDRIIDTLALREQRANANPGVKAEP